MQNLLPLDTNFFSSWSLLGHIELLSFPYSSGKNLDNVYAGVFSELHFFFFFDHEIERRSLNQAWATFSRSRVHEMWLISRLAGCTTKEFKAIFSLESPQPFSLQKIILISNCLRNREKLIFFFGKKIFSIKKMKSW